jgi:hypothetical protein
MMTKLLLVTLMSRNEEMQAKSKKSVFVQKAVSTDRSEKKWR